MGGQCSDSRASIAERATSTQSMCEERVLALRQTMSSCIRQSKVLALRASTVKEHKGQASGSECSPDGMARKSIWKMKLGRKNEDRLENETWSENDGRLVNAGRMENEHKTEKEDMTERRRYTRK